MSTVRPTKKQRELLTFIQAFIDDHGYSPSYREIMAGLDYNSVATVAVHVNNLLTRGHIRKRDHSARSIEVVGAIDADPVLGSRDWLGEQIEQRLDAEAPNLNELKTLTESLKILQHPRTTELAQKLDELVAKTTTSSVSSL